MSDGAVYDGLAPDEYEILVEPLDDDDELAEPMSKEQRATLMRHLKRVADGGDPEAQKWAGRFQYAWRETDRNEKKIQELRAEKDTYAKRELARDVAEMFTDAGLTTSDAADFLSSADRNFSWDDLDNRIAELKEAKEK